MAMITPEQFKELMQRKPANKYRARKTELDGVTYDSATEAARANDLLLMRRAGEIAFILRQVWVTLGDIEYVADFLCGSITHGVWFEDVKGAVTPKFALVRKVWPKYGPCPLHIIRRVGSGWATERVGGA